MIFVDTSFWAATIAANDANHEEATRLVTEASDRLVTSNHVRGETWTFLNRRHGHAPAVAFVDALARTQRLRVEFVSCGLEEEALRWLRQHDEREYSFVDATSFALMRSLRIREALAFDGDFAAAGFIELRAQSGAPGRRKSPAIPGKNVTRSRTSSPARGSRSATAAPRS